MNTEKIYAPSRIVLYLPLLGSDDERRKLRQVQEAKSNEQ